VIDSENVEIIRRMFQAWNRGDRAGALAMIDPEIEIEARHESLHTGTYRGHHGMYELLKDFWAQFDDPRTEVKESIPSGDDVVVSLLHHGAGRALASRSRCGTGRCGRCATARPCAGACSRPGKRPSRLRGWRTGGVGERG
jgi:ketosteroid isomerase-like protein